MYSCMTIYHIILLWLYPACLTISSSEMYSRWRPTASYYKLWIMCIFKCQCLVSVLTCHVTPFRDLTGWRCHVTRNKGALMVTITYPHHGHVLQFHCHGDSVQAQLHTFHCYLQLWNWVLLPAQWIHGLGCTQWDTVWGWCVCRWVNGHVSACVRYTCICVYMCVCVWVYICAWVWERESKCMHRNDKS